MGTQQFCLKWNNHQSNMLSIFEQLLSTEALVDVTLACDGLSLKAHKMVLSACSPYFQSLFLENPCKHPIVIMKDMRYTELKAIIDFMYRGEVNVSHDQLNALLRTAETLKVKGLAEVSGENRTASGVVQQEIVQQSVTAVPPAVQQTVSQTRSDSPALLSKRKRGRPRKRSLSDSNRSDDDQIPSKIKQPDSPEIEELSGDASIDANDISLSSNSQTQVHQSLPSSSVNNSHINKHPSSIQSSHDPQEIEEPASDDDDDDDGDFEVEPSKLMEQSLTTDVPVMTNNTAQSTVASSVHIVPLSSGLDVNTRSMGSDTTLVPASIASDSSSQMQGPDSPQDIKPALLTFEEPSSPVAGPSQDRSMMMYMDTSGVPAIAGTSYQDNQSSLVQHDSQPQGERTLWWNQKMRLQKLQLGYPKISRNRNHVFSVPPVMLKGSSRQAVCPFCYKAFYDKSTMNRHVAKRVCLGMAFQQDINSGKPGDMQKEILMSDVSIEYQSDEEEETGEDVTTELLDYSETGIQFSETENEMAVTNKSDFSPSKDESETPNYSASDSKTSEPVKKKSNLEPCPYCKKMLKGLRGIRKHLDFYGCPMYPTGDKK